MLFRLINIHKTSILDKKYRIIFYVNIILCMLVIYNFINNMYFKNINNFNLYIDINDLIISPSEDHFLTLLEDTLILGVSLGYSEEEIIGSFI